MTILSVVQSAATAIGIDPIPDQVFGSTDRTMIEMQAYVRKSARLIRDERNRYEWQALHRTATIVGDGVTEAFALPTDYRRMLKDAKLWSASLPNWPLRRILSTDRWLELETTNEQLIANQWALFGKQIHIRPVLGSGITAQYIYLTNNIVTPQSGAAKPQFTADDDTFVLSEELLELSIVWNWKAGKGQAYDKELQDYEDMLDAQIAEDQGSAPVIAAGAGKWERRYANGDLNVPYPGEILG